MSSSLIHVGDFLGQLIQSRPLSLLRADASQGFRDNAVTPSVPIDAGAVRFEPVPSQAEQAAEVPVRLGGAESPVLDEAAAVPLSAWTARRSAWASSALNQCHD